MWDKALRCMSAVVLIEHRCIADAVGLSRRWPCQQKLTNHCFHLLVTNGKEITKGSSDEEGSASVGQDA